MTETLFAKIMEKQPRCISIIGLAKNTGKTTTLNHLIAEAQDRRGLRLGITSTGWDGERFDSITGKPKPRIVLRRGTLAATTADCASRGDAEYRILEKTGLRTSLGDVILIEITKTGRLEIAGPTTLTELALVRNKLWEQGCDLLLFDGAIDRKAASSPRICDGIVLATGLNAGYSIENVCDTTAYWIDIYDLPLWSRSLEECDGGVCSVFTKEGTLKGTFSAFGEEKNLPLSDAGAVYVPGALFEGLAEKLLEVPDLKAIIAEDPAAVFLNPSLKRRMEKKNKKLFVRKTSPVLAITANPVSSSGNSMESGRFLDIMAKICSPHPVWDIVAGKERQQL